MRHLMILRGFPDCAVGGVDVTDKEQVRLPRALWCATRPGPNPVAPAQQHETCVRVCSRVVSLSKRSRVLLSRVLLTLFLVIVFTGVAWDDNGSDGRYLGIDVAVGLGTTAVIYACWWLVKRSLVGTKRALHEGYRDALALERKQGRYLPRCLSEPSRSVKPTPVVRDLAGRAGRFVGSVQRAYRDGRTDSG
jgi:hypothetical protein